MRFLGGLRPPIAPPVATGLTACTALLAEAFLSKEKLDSLHARRLGVEIFWCKILMRCCFSRFQIEEISLSSPTKRFKTTLTAS